MNATNRKHMTLVAVLVTYLLFLRRVKVKH